MTRINLNLVASSLVLTLLVGCGGGTDAGPGTGNNAGGPIVPNTALTGANASAVAGAVTDEASHALDLGSDVIKHAVLELFEEVTPVAAASLAIPRHGAEHTAGVEAACHDGGTKTLTMVDANEDEVFNAGDSHTVVFAECVDGSNEINGTLEVTLELLEGDPLVGAPYEIHADVTVEDLTVTPVTVAAADAGHAAMEGMVTVNGAFVLDIDATVESETVTIETHPQLTIQKGDETVQLYEFTMSETHDEASGAKSKSFSGVIDVSGIGAVNVATITAIKVLADADHPSEGQVKLTGDDSSLTITAGTDAESVTLEVDDDNDGVTDSTTETTWADL